MTALGRVGVAIASAATGEKTRNDELVGVPETTAAAAAAALVVVDLLLGLTPVMSSKSSLLPWNVSARVGVRISGGMTGKSSTCCCRIGGSVPVKMEAEAVEPTGLAGCT